MAKLMEKLKTLSAKPYAEQAKYFLNAYWKEVFESSPKKREQVWKDCQNMIKLDVKKGGKGCELSEIKAHLFIEKTGSATTWVKFRNVMKEIDVDFNNHMSLTEYFIFRAKLDWKDLVKRDTVYDKAAQDALDEANAALDEARAAMMEVKAGLARIQAEEDKKAAYIAKKKKIAEDESLSTVKRGKAFNEMKQAEGEDPLPLRKAKLEQKAAVRRAVKAVNAASKVVSRLAAKLMGGGVGEGVLWWMDRELEEAITYLPKSKQAAARKKMKKQKEALLAASGAKTAAIAADAKKGGKKKKNGSTKSANKDGKLDMKTAAAAFGGAKGKLKRRKGKKKHSGVDRAKVQMEIGGDAKVKLKHVTKKKKKKKTVDALGSALVQMEIKGDHELHHVETHGGDGPSDAVKEAFIEDQKAKKAEATE